MMASRITSFLRCCTKVLTGNRLAGGVAIIDKSRMPPIAIFNVRGIGVAVKVRISTLLRSCLIFSFCFFISCSNSESSLEEAVIDYDELNEIEIQEYILENNLNLEKSNTGLYYIITEEGTGESPSISSNVTVYYKLYRTFLSPNTPIQESPLDGVDFNLDQVIPGFAEGLTYLKEGGEATLIIPSKLAYPFNYPSNLAGQVLIFEIKLISIN